MSKIMLRANGPLDGNATPLRSGRASGEAGASVLLRNDLDIVSIVAARGKTAMVAERARAMFGIDLPIGPRRSQIDSVTALGIGPAKWMVLREGGVNLTTELSREFSGLASVCDHSSGYAVFRINGPDSRKALAKGVPIDLRPKSFGPNDCAVTQIAHIGAILWQTNEAPIYEVAVFRSYAGSFWHWLQASAAEFGVTFERPVF